MDPYRSADPDAIAEAPSDQGIVGDIIAQFADRFAFFRELVQNAIDAGTPSVEVRLDYDAETKILHAAVADRGEGMSRDVIENQLLVLFRSTKEADRTKIGKFGIGFASVLSPNPEIVTVQTTRDGRRLVLHLARDLTYRLFDAGPATQTGTTVELELAMPANEVAGFAAASRDALVRWCRHAAVPIEFRGLGAASVRIDRPLALEGAVVSVTGKSDDGQLVAIVGITAGPTSVGFYNHGLTLYETRDPLVGDAAAKIQDARLGHTLSRDDVRRDAVFDHAIAFATNLASIELPAAINAQLHAAAKAGEHARHRAIVDAASVERDTRLIHGLIWQFPLVVPHAGATSCDLAKQRVVWASTANGDLARAACAELDVPILAIDGGQHDWLALVVHRLTGKQVRIVDQELTRIVPVDDPPAALLAELARVLGKVHRAPSQIIAARLQGAHAGSLALAGTTRGELVDTDAAAASPFGRLKRPPLVLNVAHLHVQHAVEKDPRLGAHLLAREILLGHRLLDRDRSIALIEDAFAQLEVP